MINSRFKTYRTLFASLILAASAVSSGINAQVAPVKVTASVDSAAITMAGLTTVRVEVLKNSRGGSMPEIDQLRRQLAQPTNGNRSVPPELAGIEVRQIDVDSADLGNGRIQVNYSLLVQPFTPDTINLPPFHFAQNGDTFSSNIVALKILEPDMPQEMRDSLWINPMRPPLTVASKWYDWVPDSWYWWLGGLALAALIAAVILLYKKNGKTLLPGRKRVPPHVLAERRLKELKSRQLAERGHAKAYYTELTDILRQYLGGRFKIYALEMTSTQILEAMAADSETASFVDMLRPMLRVADFVKFAKQVPTTDENIRSFRIVEDFVRDTAPKPEPEVADATQNKSKK